MRRVYWWSLLALLVSCTEDIEYFRDNYAPLPHVADVTYWVDPEFGSNQEKIASAAALLGYMGFTLRPSAYVDADITVRIGTPDECTDTKRIAHKDPCGDLTFCGRYLGTVYDVASTYAHEMGHALGVQHVELQCTSDTKVDPTYGPACGPALMNPESNGDLEDFTVVDAADFLQNRIDSMSVFTQRCSRLKALRQQAPSDSADSDQGAELAN